MTHYIIYFNQHWVGHHSDDWFANRGPLAAAVVAEMKDAGVYVFAGGLHDLDSAFHAVPTSGTVKITDGPYAPAEVYLGGLTVVDVPDLEEAKRWAGKLAEACGWPQEVRRIE